MNFLDLVAGGLDPTYASRDELQTLPLVPQTKTSATEAPPQAQAPNVLDLLTKAMAPQASAQPAPQPAADGTLPGMAWLEFAARAAQPRRRGQSTMAKILEAGTGALSSYANNKKQLEDREAQKQKDAKHRELQDEQIKQARVSTAAKAQEIIATEQQRPIELRRAKILLDKAVTDQDIARVDLELKKAKEKYADELAKWEVEERKSRDTASKALAAERQAMARKHIRETELMKEAIEARRKNPSQPVKDWKVQEPDAPGGPSYMWSQTSSRRYRLPMDPSFALRYAEMQVEALDKITPYKSRQEKESAKRAMAEDLIKGETPPAEEAAPNTTPAPAGGSAPAAPAAAGPTSDPDLAAAQKQSADTGKALAFQDKSGQRHYFIAGKPVSKAEFEARKPKPGAAPAPAAAPELRPGQFNGKTINPTGT